ncbi:MAG: ABC transporter ATP-binding protein [Magnetovibrionaceae bacterium]
MLTVENLFAGYGAATALHGISLELREGEVLSLLGRNGAGKSSLLKAVVGLIPERRGAIRLRNADLMKLPTAPIIRLGIGYVPEERRIFPGLTVEENLKAGRRGDAPGPWTDKRLFELFPNLAELRDRLGARISGGEQQMLALARTLAGNPRIVLLDEPSEGLAPKIVENLADAIQALKQEGLSILLAEQNVRFANALADRAVILETGYGRWTGTMAELAADEQIRRAYLEA